MVGERTDSFTGREVLTGRTVIEQIQWVLIVALVACFYLLDQSDFGSLTLIGLTLSITFLSVFTNHGKFTFRFEKYHGFVFLFATFCLLSSLWALNSSYSITAAITIYEIGICMTLLYSSFSKRDSIHFLLNAIVWAGFVVSLFFMISNGLTNIAAIAAVEGRVDTEVTNVNNIATLGAMSTVISFYYLLFTNRRKTSLIILTIPCVMMVALSGTRKALLGLVAGIIILVWQRYKTKNIVRTIFRIIIAFSIVIVLLFLLSKLPIFSVVTERMEGVFSYLTGNGKVDSSTAARAFLIQIGLDQFKKTPILGIGIGNPRLLAIQYFGHNCYLHNNYVELLAGGGLVGMVLYYLPFIYATYFIIKNRGRINKTYCIVIVILILLLAMDYGQVSYYSKMTYFYLLLMHEFIHINREYNIQESFG